MDADGYPDENELQTIRNWSYTDVPGLFAYIKDLWAYADWGWDEYDGEDYGRPVRIYRISTAGWSGNEDLIRAFQENVMCWHLSWHTSRRGGHYEFWVKK